MARKTKGTQKRKGKSTAAPTARWIRNTLMPEIGGDPENRAQQLIYSAWEITRPTRRAEMAREAIAIWPDCADAYNLLAEHTADLGEAIAFRHQAVEAGARALDPEIFKEAVGHFWGILETRPYMRARAGLAALLWKRGEREPAAQHYRELLRLNPNDNQGIRYLLAAQLVELDRDDELAALLERYDEDSAAAWDYTKVLLAFRQEGDSEPARLLLLEAVKTNPHVPTFLLGRKKLPRQLPDLIGLGDESEAIAYAADNLLGWKHTQGAIEWLAAQVK